MNVYVVIEGEKAMKKLYSSWIKYVNNDLSSVDTLQDITTNNFLIVAGYGQPSYWNVVDNAVQDVNKIEHIDRLVISIDSEEKSYEEKYAEAKERVEKVGCRAQVHYVIQHFCIETWLLGNIHIFRKNSQDQDLQEFERLFDIRKNDPELLPDNKQRSWNRSQFALRYLKAGIRDIYGFRKSYSKHNSELVSEMGYFYQVRERFLHAHQILSFKSFLDAFTP